MKKSSLFIAIEGADGTGKSTQCQLLADWIRKQSPFLEVVTCADPGSTDLGQQLRHILLNQSTTAMSMRSETLLFMASRTQLVDEVIRPALDRGAVVISDRFLLSNVVYQGHAGGIDPEEIRQLGQFAVNGIMPDLTILLDATAETLAPRRKKMADNIEKRGADFFQRVRDGFLAEAHSGQLSIVLDATQSVENVQSKIRRLYEDHPSKPKSL